MNFSAKERKILLFLAIIALPVLYFYLFYRPQTNAMKTLKEEIRKYSDNYVVNQAAQKAVEGKDSDIKVIRERLKDLRTIFPPVLNYDEILIFIRDISKNAGLSIENISFNRINAAGKGKSDDTVAGNKDNAAANPSDIKDIELKQAFDALGMGSTDAKDTEKEITKDVVIEYGKGYVLSLKISAKCNYSQLKNFLNSLKSKKNKMTVTDIQMDNVENGMVKAGISLDFYGIMDNSTSKYTLLQDGAWVPLDSGKKGDIFKPYDSYFASLNNENKSKSNVQGTDWLQNELNSSDFSMGVLPYGGNMTPPTVTLVAKRMVSDPKSLLIPIIYGDSKGEENVELYIEEKEGKFYCKFKTDHEAFPDQGYSQTLEFKPAGKEIKLLINSTLRKFKQDESGVILNIINRTSKELTVKVVNEDKEKPRVKINFTGSNVKAIYM